MIAIISPRAGGAPRHEINRTFSLGELLGRERRCVQPCRTLIGSGFKLSAGYVGPPGVAGSHQYHVDGAHTHESLQYALEWFVAPDTALRQK